MKTLLHNTLDFAHKTYNLLFDSAAMMACFWLGYRIWVASPYRMQAQIPEFDWVHVLFYVLIIDAALVWGGTYKIESSVSHVVRLKELIKYCTVGFATAIAVGFFTRFLLIGRLQVLITFGIMLPTVVIERLLADKLWTHLVVKKLFMKRVIIYGAGDTGKRLARAIGRHPKLGYSPVGFFDDHKTCNSVIMANPLPFLGDREAFAEYLAQHKNRVDEVIIAMPAADTEANMQIMGLCLEYGVPFKFVPTLNDLMLHRVRQEQIDGIPLFSNKEIGITLVNRIFKRAFDLVVSVLILIPAAPLLGLIAALIRRDSPGPVIFRQKRVGYKGREFKMYKFRTMFTESPQYDWHPKVSNDPRITRMGRFLRKTSFDELPQFWNVLKGEMSIVGPRPEMPFIVETYNTYHRERLNAKPGITGLWQISGDRSLPIHENIDHDLYYITHQSLLLDIVIILQTVWFALIRGVGAK